MNGYQFIVTLAASCGGLLYGYEIGVMNVVLVMDAFRIFFRLYQWKDDHVMINEMDDDITKPYVKDKSHVYRKLEEMDRKPFVEGFVTSSLLFGAIFGAILSSHLSNKTSSQKIIMVSGLIFTLGSIIQGSTFLTFFMLSFGRFIAGIAIGCVSVLCPTYVAEVAPARIRNSVITCYQLMIGIGIATASIVNGLIWYTTNVNPEANQSGVSSKEWRIALWLQVIPGLLLSFLMYFLPCSPRYLCSQNKDKEAISVLAKLNGTSTTDILVQEEYKATINSVINMESLGRSTYKELFDHRNRRRSFIAFFMQFFQQCTGINGILYYQTQLYQGVGFSRVMSVIILPFINNIIYFISSFIGMFNVQRINRKHLLVIGGAILLLLNIAISTTSNHTLDHFEYRLNENIDCAKEKDDMAYHSVELQNTFYGNNCHAIVVTCSDNRNVISFESTTATYTTEQLDDICHEMNSLRYSKGNLRRNFFAISIFLFSLVYGCTWGPVPKVYQAEVFPLRMRVKGTTFSTISHFISSWIVVFITPILIKIWGMHAFVCFSVLCYLALMFTIFGCVESRGLSMEEIDEEMVLIKS